MQRPLSELRRLEDERRRRERAHRAIRRQEHRRTLWGIVFAVTALLLALACARLLGFLAWPF